MLLDMLQIQYYLHYLFQKIIPIVDYVKQWGSGDGYDGANPSWYSFPIAFPSACYQVVTNGKGNGYGAKDGNSCGACNWNTKQVQLYSNDGTKPVNYIAIGK